MKVSIVTVVYNGERHLQEAIDSVLSQNFTDYEYLILDGGSEDSTLDIIHKNIDSIHGFYHQESKGLSNAMNESLKYCNGEYIVFMHADDRFVDENSLSELVSKVDRSNSCWGFGLYKYIDGESNYFREDVVRDLSYRDMEIRNVVRHQASIVSRSVFESVQFEERYKYAMDYKFFMNVWSKYGDPEIVKSHIACFRIDGNNLSSNYVASLNNEFKARYDFRRENGNLHKLPVDIIIYLARWFKIQLYHRFKKPFWRLNVKAR